MWPIGAVAAAAAVHRPRRPPGVFWPDGAATTADTVLLGTGYRPHLPYLTGLGALDETGRPRHRRASPPRAPGWCMSVSNGNAACRRRRCGVSDATPAGSPPPGPAAHCPPAPDRRCVPAWSGNGGIMEGAPPVPFGGGFSLSLAFRRRSGAVRRRVCRPMPVSAVYHLRQ